MFKKILKACLFCCLFVFANANESLTNEILNGGRGFGCNEEKTECWNVDWLGEERFYLSSVGIKAVGKDSLNKDACERVIKHYLQDDQEAFAAKNLVIDSIDRADQEFKKSFKETEFKVYSYKKENSNGKEPENITTCEINSFGSNKLVNFLKKEKYDCILQDGSTLICENFIDNNSILFYLKGTDANVLIEKTLNANEEYDASKVFENQKKYCHYAFDNMLGDESKRAKELLNFNIKKEKGSEVIYSAMMYDPTNNIKKTVSVFTVDEKKEDYTTVATLCFISPLISLYM